jgi:DNA replication and repair protein RecF
MVVHGPKDEPAATCSTGEQKALLSGLILAQARLIAQMRGSPPLLLLDEIAAHLDEARRAALFHMLDQSGGQAFMTGTDAHLFETLPRRGERFSVTDGRIGDAA